MHCYLKDIIIQKNQQKVTRKKPSLVTFKKFPLKHAAEGCLVFLSVSSLYTCLETFLLERF